MSTYYQGKRATTYNRTWKAFSEKTLTATLDYVDTLRLYETPRGQEKPVRILDAACGTGLLLKKLASLFPQAELYGIDQSPDMLTQAQKLLADEPRFHLTQGSLSSSRIRALPYQPASFDLITCTNTFHYLDDPQAVLRGLTTLLTPGGQLVVEDYARRSFPFPWRPFEWLIKRVDPQHNRAYTRLEAQQICEAAGFHILAASDFSAGLLWQCWVIRAALK
ncbi:class I SAM-dependent methyltransferase [Dictyobacter aurantiacus]|uniref:Methyltransferase type 12 domain-containing protein n=1 Tax=Dictyobacter aurantiacus TaxID=1936993 RepID=A0A401Z8S6_9CHLR|nr:class I SAM-dependent methyltransferase [Dictyobacter aurantiacus]GCE03264.1 hypothetical protein KDAU_05930 [Dictyobacter aurantiacus]